MGSKEREQTALAKFREENATPLREFKTLVEQTAEHDDALMALIIHDDADIDAMGSAVALRRFLESHEITARIYGNGIGAHAENKAFANEFGVKILEEDIPDGAIRIYIDFSAPSRSVHATEEHEPAFVFDTHDAEARVAATSSWVTLFLLALGCDIEENKEMATALYLGIVKDTDFLTSHAVRDWDKAAFKALGASVSISRWASVIKTKRPETAINIKGWAFHPNHRRQQGHRYVALAGFIGHRESVYLAEAADELLQIEGIETVLVAGIEEVGDNLFLCYSVRTSSSSADTDEIARIVREGLSLGNEGDAGGRYGFAGARLQLDAFTTDRIRKTKNGTTRDLDQEFQPLLETLDRIFLEREPTSTDNNQ